MFAGKKGPVADALVLNAGVALAACGIAARRALLCLFIIVSLPFYYLFFITFLLPFHYLFITSSSAPSEAVFCWLACSCCKRAASPPAASPPGARKPVFFSRFPKWFVDFCMCCIAECGIAARRVAAQRGPRSAPFYKVMLLVLCMRRGPGRARHRRQARESSPALCSQSIFVCWFVRLKTISDSKK